MSDTTSGDQSRPRGRRHSNAVSGREALLDAAITSFAQHGYQAASLRMIAREAGVDVALCARLFGNKAKLWQAVIDTLQDNFEQHMKAELLQIVERSKQDPEQAMRDFIAFYVRLCSSQPAMPAFLLHEATASLERIEIIQKQLIKPLMQLLVPVVIRARDAGVVQFNNPLIFIRMMASSLSMLLAAPRLLPDEALAASVISEHLIAEAEMIFLRSVPRATTTGTS